MKKQEFLDRLCKSLDGLPREDVKRTVEYYSEMIDDRVEEGIPEESAVEQMGSIEDIVAQTLAEIPLARLVKERIKPKRQFGTWTVLLLVLGSPIWLSLLVAAFSVLISLYAAIWSVAVSFWAAFVSLIASGGAGIVAGVAVAIFQNTSAGVALVGLGLACAGLSVFLFFGCKAMTKGMVFLTKGLALGVKKLFIGKGKSA